MPTYASKTTVTVERSRAEIERILERFGASSFAYGWDETGAMVAFVVTIPSGQQRKVQFHLPLPDKERFYGRRGNTLAAERAWQQACRQRWRALALVIKAKLEAVESEISSFEAEFLAFIVLPSGETVGQWLEPQIEDAYDSGEMPPGLRLALGTGS